MLMRLPHDDFSLNGFLCREQSRKFVIHIDFQKI